VKRVQIEEQDVPAIGARALARNGGWRVYRIDAIPEDGVRFTITLAGAARARATFADVSFALPESARDTAALRDRTGLAMQDGDLTIVLGRGLE
jgi:hypothetical protein